MNFRIYSGEHVISVVTEMAVRIDTRGTIGRLIGKGFERSEIDNTKLTVEQLCEPSQVGQHRTAVPRDNKCLPVNIAVSNEPDAGS